MHAFMTSDCYCIVLRQAARKVSATYDAALEPVGVNIAQFSMMRKVARKGQVSLTELGRMTELDRSTVSRNVRVLERSGLVGLSTGKDQREAEVSLTESGQKVLADGAPLWDAVQAKMEAVLGPGNGDQLRALLAAF